VASPALDAQGNIYTTISGTKGQHVPVSLYRIFRKAKSYRCPRVLESDEPGLWTRWPFVH
jgi:hypothetical protein